MSQQTIEEPWYETALIYTFATLFWLFAFVGVPWIAETYGLVWLVGAAVAVAGFFGIFRVLKWAVRSLCRIAGRPSPDFASETLPIEWAVDEAAVTVREVGVGGREISMRYDQLQAVLIETTSAGPWAEDFFYVLCDRERSLHVPLSVACEHDLTDHLFDLPDFDHAAAIVASGSTDDQVFVCWEAPGWDGSVE